MNVDRILTLKLVTDVGNIDRQLSGVQGRISKVGAAFGSWGKAAGLGIALGAIDAVGSALSQGLSDFRASERAGANLARTWERLGLKGSDLEGVIDDISGRAIELGFDDTESVAAFDRLLKKTKDVDTSQRLLAAAWDLARSKQIPLEQAVSEVTKLYDGSSKALKQYGLEGVSGLAAVDAAMLTNAGAAEEWAGTQEGKLAVLQGKVGEVFETLAGAGVTLLGQALGPLENVANTLGELWTENEPKLLALVEMIGPKIGAAIGAVSTLVAALAPHFVNAWALIEPIVDTMATVIGETFDVITGVIEAVAALLNGDFTAAFDAAGGVVESLLNIVTTVMDGTVEAITGIVGAVGTAAGDVASSLFDGLVNGLTGLGGAITDAVVGGIRSGLNALIRIWNDLAIPGFSIHIPDISVPNPLHGTVLDPVGKPHIPILGASDFQLWGRLALPNIPRLADGGIVPARPGGMLAILGEGRHDEAVVPLRSGGLGGNVYNITVNVAPGGDAREAGRQIVAALRAYEAVEGAQWRA